VIRPPAATRPALAFSSHAARASGADPRKGNAMFLSPRLTGFAAATFVGLATLAAPHAAQARIFMATNGGSACKPAYGASTKFNFTEYYALNNGTTDQYVVCNFNNWSVNPVDSTALALEMLAVYFNSGATTGGTAVCTVKMGYWTNGASTESQMVKSIDLTPNSAGSITFTGADLPRKYEFQGLSMNCKVPGGFRLGLIQRFEPEPSPGMGWSAP